QGAVNLKSASPPASQGQGVTARRDLSAAARASSARHLSCWRMNKLRGSRGQEHDLTFEFTRRDADDIFKAVRVEGDFRFADRRDELHAEAVAIARDRGRSTTLDPRKAQVHLRWPSFNAPADEDATPRRRECTIFRGVGRELMKNERKRLGEVAA